MSDSKIFCNTPWYELHIYWDGSLGICCQESHKLYQGSDYNIATTTIEQWFNSPPVQQFRQQVLGHSPVSACSRCYLEEAHSGMSRRLRSNQKSAIFSQAFDVSFEQSPGRKYFDFTGVTTTSAIDLHIDLGNVCNLACKMCDPKASSKIASQQVRWGITESKQFIGTDWTKDPLVWHSFKQQLLTIPELNNIHLMGGETLLSDKFHDLVDWMVEHQRFDLGFSFVTNGTIFDLELMTKLKKFRQVGIEVSIETVDQHNSYVRQGTDTDQVISNIGKFQQWANGSNITVTLRSAISALTIGYFVSLLQFALDKQLIIKSLLVINPKFLDVAILPDHVKQVYKKPYLELLDQLDNIDVRPDFNASDPHNYAMVVKEHCEMCVNLLSVSQPSNVQSLLDDLVKHCQRWDQVYQLDAQTLYPELQDIWHQYGY